MASIVLPLTQLLQSTSPWSWGREQDLAFACVKKQLADSTALIHFSPGLPLRLTTDASDAAVGAVLE